MLVLLLCSAFLEEGLWLSLHSHLMYLFQPTWPPLARYPWLPLACVIPYQFVYLGQYLSFSSRLYPGHQLWWSASWCAHPSWLGCCFLWLFSIGRHFPFSSHASFSLSRVVAIRHLKVRYSSSSRFLLWNQMYQNPQNTSWLVASSLLVVSF